MRVIIARLRTSLMLQVSWVFPVLWESSNFTLKFEGNVDWHSGERERERGCLENVLGP